MAIMQRRTSGNGHVLPRGSRGDGSPLDLSPDELPPIGRPSPGEGLSTGGALAAVARDAIDVASELVRDGITLGRLEAQRAIAEMTPRVVWGAITAVCVAAGGVLAIIAIMIALGSVIPSVAGRLAILAGALFVVAFFGAIRVMRPGTRSETVSAKEPAISEGRSEEVGRLPQPGATGRTPPLTPLND
jgi:hypothetical protein